MSFAHPLWLIAIVIVPALAIFAILRGRLGAKISDKFIAPRLRKRLVRTEHPLPRLISLFLLLAAITGLFVVVARPQGDAGVKTEKTIGRNVMIALDLSRSMQVTDVEPDRLAQAKIVIYELLETLENDRIGLIGFAGTPLLAAPLTIDHIAVRETVEQIDPEWVSVGGSDLSAAIRLATETFKETGQKNNALVLISDGEEHSNDLNQIVTDAERAGVTIFAIGIGTEDGGFVPHPDFPEGLIDQNSGARIISQLQPETLRKLADDTGGKYIIAGRTGNIGAILESAIQAMDSFEMEGGQTRVVIEFFQWALLPVVLFLMSAIVAGTRWRSAQRANAPVTPVLLFLVSLLPLSNLKAQSPSQAKEAFQKEDYTAARDAYRSLAEKSATRKSASQFKLGEGLSAYAAQDYRTARSAYSEALFSEDQKTSGKAHEGLGNTLFQLGWIGLAGSRYGQLEDTPDLADFDRLVRAQLAKMAQNRAPEAGDKSQFTRLDSIILNWTDAVRHYRSAMKKLPKDPTPPQNEELVMIYLKRLEELLKEEQERAEQEAQQQQQQQQGEPQAGEGQESDPNAEGQDPSQGGENQEDEAAGDQDEQEEENGPGEEDAEEEDTNASENEGDAEPEDPNESAEERARRILEENSDVEKGPMNPGRREFRSPQKDY